MFCFCMKMAFVCAISGEVPEEAVVSPVSGAIFERRLIEKHLASSDSDPVNGEPLTVDQLVEVKTPKTVRPRMPAATSIPGLLKTFQDEWDAVMLETYKMRQSLDKSRQELAHALYQHDAACRVIARLVRERDQARQALATLQAGGAVPSAAAAAAGEDNTAMDVEGGISADIVEKLNIKSKELSKWRKKRSKPEGMASADDIKAFTLKTSIPGLHSSHSGINCLSLHPSNNNLLITGGGDKKAVLFDREKAEVVHEFKGHGKKVVGALLHPREDIAITCSHDNTVKVWNSASGDCTTTISTHTKNVNGISLHPTGDYVISCSDDTQWAFSDISSGHTLASAAAGDAALTSIEFHPDGLFFAAGTHNSLVRIWDIKEQKELETFQGHNGSVDNVAFSENGKYLATAADNVVLLWDLRTLKTFQTLQLPADYSIKSLNFDYYGGYLAVAGNGINVFDTKTWSELATFNDHTKEVTAAKFTTNARSIISASNDRTIGVFA